MEGLIVISCICITKNKRELLDAAIRCFENQTYKDKELVIMYESDNPNREYLTRLPYNVICVKAGKYTLGAQRNLAIQKASGDYIAQWDDDDLYRNNRLKKQIHLIHKTRKDGCVLTRQVLFCDGGYYLSHYRLFWENSLLIKKSSMIPYFDLEYDEDRLPLGYLYENKKLAQLDNPYLYIYRYHGDNTWPRTHFDGFIRKSKTKLETPPRGIYDQGI